MDAPEGLESLVGMTALVEVGSIDVTATIVEISAQSVILGCGEECWTGGEARQAVVTVFTPDALFRLAGPVVVDKANLVSVNGMAIERIQRRRWPRRAMDMPVILCPIVEGLRVEGVPGRTIDLGIGGLCVETLREVEGEGDPMIILSLPDGTTIVAGTSTIDARDLGDGWRYRLAFHGIDANDAGRLASFTT